MVVVIVEISSVGSKSPTADVVRISKDGIQDLDASVPLLTRASCLEQGSRSGAVITKVGKTHGVGINPVGRTATIDDTDTRRGPRTRTTRVGRLSRNVRRLFKEGAQSGARQNELRANWSGPRPGRIPV